MYKQSFNLIILIIFISILKPGIAQNHDSDLFPVNGAVFHIDSMPNVILDEVTISSSPTKKYQRKIRKYNSLVRKVTKVYPYAKLANERINEIEEHVTNLENEAEKKEYIKKAEDELMAEFEEPITKLTFSEGRILIKLIDRETGNTSYELIKRLRGRFSAFFWQTVAVVFGSNLKSEYDPEEDMMIENIIVRIENGEIPTAQIK